MQVESSMKKFACKDISDKTAPEGACEVVYKKKLVGEYCRKSCLSTCI